MTLPGVGGDGLVMVQQLFRNCMRRSIYTGWEVVTPKVIWSRGHDFREKG